MSFTPEASRRLVWVRKGRRREFSLSLLSKTSPVLNWGKLETSGASNPEVSHHEAQDFQAVLARLRSRKFNNLSNDSHLAFSGSRSESRPKSPRLQTYGGLEAFSKCLAHIANLDGPKLASQLRLSVLRPRVSS